MQMVSRIKHGEAAAVSEKKYSVIIVKINKTSFNNA